MGWVDYDQLNVKQKVTFRVTNPKVGPHFYRYRAWVKPDGRVSMRQGHWEWTERYAQQVDAAMSAAAREAISGEQPPSKDNPKKFKTATFHLDRYR